MSDRLRFRLKFKVFKNPGLLEKDNRPRIRECERKTRAMSELCGYAFDVFAILGGGTIALNFINSCIIENNAKSFIELAFLLAPVVFGGSSLIYELFGDRIAKLSELVPSELEAIMSDIKSLPILLNSKTQIDNMFNKFLISLGLEKDEFRILSSKIDEPKRQVNLTLEQWEKNADIKTIENTRIAELETLKRIRNNIILFFILKTIGISKDILFEDRQILDTLRLKEEEKTRRIEKSIQLIGQRPAQQVKRIQPQGGYIDIRALIGQFPRTF